MTPNNRGYRNEGVSSAANRLTFAAPCFMIYLSLGTNHPIARKGQANQPRQYSSIVRVSRLSHAPQPLADYQGKGWGAADSRDFRVLSGRAGECGKHKPAPNQRVEEATQ